MIPDLSNRTLFPPFLELPEAGAESESKTETETNDVPGETADRPTLLAQVKNNMTINKPTLVLSDRDGHSFALVFEGLDRDGLDLEGLGFRPGATIVVPSANRTVPTAPVSNGSSISSSSGSETINSKAAKRPFLRIPAGQAHTVQAVPAALDQIVAAAARLRRQDDTGHSQQQQQQQQQQQERQCDACGAAQLESGPGARRLLKCTGCSEVWYCNRACQTNGWKEGHKGECKAMRAVSTVWGS